MLYLLDDELVDPHGLADGQLVQLQGGVASCDLAQAEAGAQGTGREVRGLEVRRHDLRVGGDGVRGHVLSLDVFELDAVRRADGLVEVVVELVAVPLVGVLCVVGLGCVVCFAGLDLVVSYEQVAVLLCEQIQERFVVMGVRGAVGPASTRGAAVTGAASGGAASDGVVEALVLPVALLGGRPTGHRS